MTRALVFGGGGPVGIAWEIGIAAGLADAGIVVATADRIVGTSAGSIVGAQLASGRPAADLYADHLFLAGQRGSEHSAGGSPIPDLQPLIGFMIRRPQNGFPGSAFLAEVGAYAVSAATIDEAAFLARIGTLLPADPQWSDRFVCTAVDAQTGAFQVWDRASKVDLLRAVASSCAVPGLYPPIGIGGARYIDGGIRSATNTDLASGCSDVLVVAVTMAMAADYMVAAARRELAPLEQSGSRTTLITPDAACLAAFGPSLMDTSRSDRIAAVGREQGRAEAARLGAAWRGLPAHS